jgi:hypothetical protein
MTDECYRSDELEELAATPPGDPRRAHLAECPRCRTDLAAYLAFMNPGPHPAEADPEDARTRLAAALEREILPAQSPHTGVVREPQQPPDHPVRAFWRSMTRPVLRPVWGLAAVVLLIVAAQQAVQFSRRAGEPIVLRGPAEAAAEAVTASMEMLDDGSVRFRWPPVTGAESYSIALYRGDLSQLDRFDAGAATTLLLDAQTIARLSGAATGGAVGGAVGSAAGGAAGGSAGGEPILYWRLLCLRGGEQYAHSTLGSLDVQR